MNTFIAQAEVGKWDAKDPKTAFQWYANGFEPAFKRMTKDELEKAFPALTKKFAAVLNTNDLKTLNIGKMIGRKNAEQIRVTEDYEASNFYLRGGTFGLLLTAAGSDSSPLAEAALRILSAIYKQVVLGQAPPAVARSETLEKKIERLESAYRAADKADDQYRQTAHRDTPETWAERDRLIGNVFHTQAELAVALGQRPAASEAEKGLSDFASVLLDIYAQLSNVPNSKSAYAFFELWGTGKRLINRDPGSSIAEQVVALKRVNAASKNASNDISLYNDALVSARKLTGKKEWPEDDDEAAPLVGGAAAREIAKAREALEEAETELAELKGDERGGVENLLKGQVFKADAALAIAEGKQPSPAPLTAYLAMFAKKLLALYSDLEKSTKNVSQRDLLRAEFFNLWTDGKAPIEADLGVEATASVIALTPIDGSDEPAANKYNESLQRVEVLGAEIRGGASDASSEEDAPDGEPPSEYDATEASIEADQRANGGEESEFPTDPLLSNIAQFGRNLRREYQSAGGLPTDDTDERKELNAAYAVVYEAGTKRLRENRGRDADTGAVVQIRRGTFTGGGAWNLAVTRFNEAVEDVRVMNDRVLTPEETDMYDAARANVSRELEALQGRLDTVTDDKEAVRLRLEDERLATVLASLALLLGDDGPSNQTADLNEALQAARNDIAKLEKAKLATDALIRQQYSLLDTPQVREWQFQLRILARAADIKKEDAERLRRKISAREAATGLSTTTGSLTGGAGDSAVDDVYLSYTSDMTGPLKDFYAAYRGDRYGDAYNAAESIKDRTEEAYRRYADVKAIPADIYTPRWFLSDIFRDESNISWQNIKNNDSRARLKIAFRHAMVDVLAKALDEFRETAPNPTLTFDVGTNGIFPNTEYGKARKKYADVVKEIRGVSFFDSLETSDSYPRFGSGATTGGPEPKLGTDPRPSPTRALTGGRPVTAATFPRVESGAPTESDTTPSRRFDFFTLIEPSARKITEPPEPKEVPATQAFDPNNFWYYGPVGTNGFSKADDEKHFRYSRGLEKVQGTNPWIPRPRADSR